MKIEEGDLFGADVSSALPTFDQIVQRHGGDIAGVDVAPNYRQDAELVIEPVAGGQCVSFRDADHQSLLTFIAGRGGGSSLTTQAAVMGALRDTIRARQKNASAAPEAGKDDAIAAIEAFKTDVLDKILKDSVEKKTESRATRIRAAAVIDALADARKLFVDRLLAARAAAPEE